MGNKSIYKWTGIVTVLLIISRFTGLLRETAIAFRFGMSAEADAYLTASLLPQILFLAFSDAVKTAFIPVYSKYHQEESGNALVLTSYVILGLFLLAASMLLVALAPWVVRLVAPGFSGKTYELTVVMSRIILPGLLFLGLSGLSSGILHTKKNFLVPALPAYPSNLIIAGFAVLLGARFGVVGLAWATLVAYASQFLIQLPAVVKSGALAKSKLLWHHSGIKEMLVLIPPVVIGGAAMELKSIVDRIFASLLPEGTIAALNYANRVFQLPNSVLVMALLAVLFPTLVELALEKNTEEFKKALRQGLSIIIFFVLPMMVGIILLREPLVRLLFERGAFDVEATKITAEALAFYCLGLLFMGGQLLLTRALYALHDTLSPMLVTFVAVALNVVFNAILLGPLKHSGLALGTALALLCQMAVLWWILRKKIGPFGGRALFVSLLKAAVAAAGMGVAIIFVRPYLTADSLLVLALKFALVVGGGALLYFFLAYLLKIEELAQGLELLRRLKSSRKN
ncbi:MAG: murein biosynthesis integral membrane protein MurJ [Firmicutes bacterium]|nr:murein biosynthesis integral membrane protein MurJ [Bacillota bacterium]